MVASAERPGLKAAARPLGGTTTARRAIFRAFLALTLLAGVSIGAPALADSEDTKEQIQDKEARLDDLKVSLLRLAAEWNAAESELAGIRDDLDATLERIDGIERRLDAVSARLERRARAIFMEGPGGTLELLLSSGSFAEFSDRLEFVGSIADADEELMLEADVQREELAREQENLRRLETRQQDVVQRLEDRKAEIAAAMDEVEELIADLGERYREQKREEQLAIVPDVGDGPPVGGTPIRVCPVAGTNSFVDSFGWPRSGGRTHEGIDMIAPLGTPVVAAHDGTVRRSYNELGGITAYVTSSNGMYTYYAHMNGYAGPSSGSVSAGTVIGYVGSTGNAGSVNHLHFALYTSGGVAVNPYSALVAVC